jgi:hypothetical protein
VREFNHRLKPLKRANHIWELTEDLMQQNDFMFSSALIILGFMQWHTPQSLTPPQRTQQATVANKYRLHLKKLNPTTKRKGSSRRSPPWTYIVLRSLVLPFSIHPFDHNFSNLIYKNSLGKNMTIWRRLSLQKQLSTKM